MRLGRLYVRISRSIWTGLGWHFVPGWRLKPILTAIRGRAWVFGRGFVASLFGVQVWLTVDDVGDSMLAETSRRISQERP